MDGRLGQVDVRRRSQQDTPLRLPQFVRIRGSAACHTAASGQVGWFDVAPLLRPGDMCHPPGPSAQSQQLRSVHLAHQHQRVSAADM